MNRLWTLLLPFALLALSQADCLADSRLLLGFESPAEVASIEVRSGGAALSDQHVTQGARSLRLPAEDYLIFLQLSGDWSGFDALDFDVYADTEGPVSLYLLIADEPWRAKPTYWNRHNSTRSLRPGPNAVSIPLGGLYRGEVGSRNNDIPGNIDIGRIVRLDLGFSPADGEGGFVYLDNMRLTRRPVPPSVRAFDFGPADQALALGFAPISPDTAYSDGAGFGWAPGARPRRAWDVTFPTRLLQDSIDAGDAAFRLRLPPGRYRALVFFEDLGYWGGEQARFTRRTVRIADSEAVTRHERWGRLDHIYRFQNTEPRPGDDLWQTYMQHLFQPVEVTFTSTGGTCDLRVEADGPLAQRIAALVIHPAGDAAAAAWADAVMGTQREEFRSRAVELPLPETEDPAPITQADRDRGYLIFIPSVEQTVYFSTLPTADQLAAEIEAFAARGEQRSLTLAVRPLRDLGLTNLELSDLRGEAGVISRGAVTISLLRHLPTRSYESLMYRIAPRYLVPADAVDLPADLTRQLWLTLRVPDDAAPGLYHGILTLRPKNAEVIRVPLRLRVLPFALDEADFITGFFDIRPDLPLEGEAYDAVQRQVFALLRERGFTSFTGGPAIPFRGLDESGAPLLDFAAADAFIAEARRAGFHREFSSYGGFHIAGLSRRYVKGSTGEELERRYGLPYEEIARRVWAAVEAHARERGWLPFTYSMCDETRVIETAREQLELMRLFNRVSPWLRTSGAYSVSFQPTEDAVALAHQEFFRVLDVSVLNRHDETVMEKARELGKEVYIYNQGRGRYPFGLYQWSERARGVGGRYEWITHIRHGYEYFDLDGREPDPGMIFYASDGLRPSLALEQCAEGMNDFRYLQTLENLANRVAQSDSAEARQAAAEANVFLRGLADSIAINQRQQSPSLDLDRIRREASERILGLLTHAPQ